MTDFADWMRSVYLGQHSFKNHEEALRSAWEAGAAAEREACAKVCDTMQKVGHQFWAPEDAEVEQGVRAGAAMCATAIRIRT